ncbi:MAG: FHA domain-containing protein [Myxococcota bacterium]
MGRDSEVFGPGALRCDRVSRRHLSVRVDADDRLTIQDLDSHNGVRLNGVPVKHATVHDGAVIAIGNVVLHAVRTHEALGDDADPAFTGIGPTPAILARAVSMLARRTAHAVLIGETGTGKRHAAEEIHQRSGGAAFVRVDAAGDRTTGDDDEIVAAAAKGTLYVDGAEAASPATERLLRRLLMDTADPGGLRIVASMRQPMARVVDSGAMRPELAARLARWSLTLPPLRERREDIPELTRALVRRHGDRALHPRLLEALCLAAWPGNLHQLDAAVSRIVAAAEPGETLSVQHYDATTTEERAPAPSTALRIQSEGEWFQWPHGPRVELAGRTTLCRLLAALLVSRTQDRDQRLSAQDLAAAGWPDDDPATRAVINRVYAAMSTLRSLGLRDAVDRTPQGYRLDPETAVEAIDASPNPSRARS